MLRVFYKNVARVDYNQCLRCGKCAQACPLHAIEWRPRSYPRVDRRLCIGCTICINACPASAIRLTRSLSVLPIALIVAIALASIGAGLLWTYKPQVAEHSVAPVTVREEWLVPELGATTPSEINMTYYMALEEEAGTEGG
jgi:Pyruvate/2-oxoacid:ferredoxin oxidoreductase delta subunit